MKAILLAGGKGTRLRPLTLHTPKPIVPMFGRAFLNYQIDLVRSVPEIDEVILSLNYQPRRIQEVFGDGHDLGIRISYVVEPSPLGTGGAIKYATGSYEDTIVVFNGDVMTQVDLGEVIRLHRSRKAKATIVLTPVDNPSAYGLVETDPEGNVRRFREKPKPEEITCDTINAGMYILEPETFDRIPRGHDMVDRAQFLPVTGRTRRDLRRVRHPGLLDRHRHAGEVRPGAPRHHGPAVPRRAVRQPAARAEMPGRPRSASRTARRLKARASSTRGPSSRPVPASIPTA